jgi:ribosomal protein S18 acetylase RimI-like enzyme
MTVIPAPARQFDRTLETGIRPFDIGRDLRAVAELIAVAFSQELDGRGADALREMRMMSHFGGLLGVMNRSTGEFNDMLSGFVWVEQGRVVGNVTVQRGDKIGSRWQIANVAVAPDYRGRGISHRLMDAALEHAVSCGGRWVVLQVYAANQVARHIYDTMGFKEVDGTSDLRISRVPTPDAPVDTAHLRSFSAGAWQLWTRPEHYGVHDITLIRWALATLQEYPRWPIEISLNTKHQTAIDLLREHGFRIQRTLLTLRKRIDGGDENDA